nr:Uncharacterised protein [Klebsiella pneumoniae]
MFSERALSYGLGLSMVLTVRSELCLLSAIWYNPSGRTKTESGGSARGATGGGSGRTGAGERYSLKSDEVTPYQEEGDFGVC